MQNRLPQHQQYPMHRAIKRLRLVNSFGSGRKEHIERQLMHSTPSGVAVGREIEDPQSKDTK